MKRNLLLGLLTLVMVCSSMAADEALSANSAQPQGDRVWLTSVSGAPGDVVVVDLMIQNALTEVDAITINLKYDTTKLQYVDWADGTLNPGWVMFNVNEKTEGEISIGGFCVKTAIKPGSQGSVATLSFKIKPEAGNEPALVSFDKIRDDIQGFNFENGKIEVAASMLKK